jgi:hypothetical protein
MMDPKDFAALVTAAGVIIGGGFALWRWRDDQKWRRVQYAQSIVKACFENALVDKACDVLDCTDETVRFRDEDNPRKYRDIRISDRLLTGALSTFDDKTDNTLDEQFVRAALDQFFFEINMFQRHIDAKLIKLNDIRPYLEYWIKEISANGRVHQNKDVAHQVYKFLDYFGYHGVLTLARDMGYPIEQGTTRA